METDLSLIEISGADDSLLEEFIKEEKNINNSHLDLDLDFTCSPLVRSKPSPQPPRVPQIEVSNEKEERAERNVSFLEDRNNKENLGGEKLDVTSLTEESNQVKRRKKGGGYNLRKSLAWNHAFFTEEGVLDSAELSRLSGAVNNDFLTSVPEEGTLSLTKDSDLEKKLFDELPVRSSKVDLKPSIPAVTKAETSTRGNAAPVPRTARRVQVVKGVNKSVSQVGGSLRPPVSSSHKNLPSTTVRNASTKDTKLPKIPPPKSESSSVSAAFKSAIGAKRSHPNQSTPTANIDKSVGTRGLSNNTKFAPGSVSSTVKSSGYRLGKNMENSVRRLSVSSQPPQASRATTSGLKVIPKPSARRATTSGLKVIPISSVVANKHVPTGDTGSTRTIASVSQNACSNDGNAPHAHSPQLAKPSGLRMPSPSMGYFSQPKVSASPIQSPRHTQSCNLHEPSIPIRKFSDNEHISEMKLTNGPAVIARMPKEGFGATKCLIPSFEVTSSNPTSKPSSELQNLLVEVEAQPDVIFDSQRPSQKQLHVDDENAGEQCVKQAEMGNPACDEVKCIPQMENQMLQLTADKLTISSGSSEQLEEHSHEENITNVTQKSDENVNGVEISQGLYLRNYEMQGYREADCLIKSQHGKAAEQSLEGKTSVNIQEFIETEAEISQNAAMLNSERHIYDGGSGTSHFTKHQREELVQGSLEKNSQAQPLQYCGVSRADDLIKLLHGEEVQDSSTRNMSIDNQESNESEVEISQALPLPNIKAPVDLIKHQHGDEIHESLKGNMTIENQEILQSSSFLNSEGQHEGDNLHEHQQREGVQESPTAVTPSITLQREVKLVRSSTLLNSDTQVYSLLGADDLVDHQHGDVHKSSKRHTLIAIQKLEESRGEIIETLPLLNSDVQVSGGADDLIEHQAGEGVQESLKANMPGENQEFSQTEVEISQDRFLVNSRVQVGGVSGADDSIEHQLGDQVHEISQENVLVDNKEVSVNGGEFSEVSPLLNSEAEIYKGPADLIEHQHVERAQELLKANLAGAADLIDHQHGEGTQEPSKANKPGVDDLIEHQHGEILAPLKGKKSLDDQELNESEIKILLPQASFLVCSDEQDLCFDSQVLDVCEGEISRTPLSAEISFEHLHGEVQQESLKRNEALDNLLPNGSEGEISQASPLLSSVMQMPHTLGDSLTRCQLKEEVQKSPRMNSLGYDKELDKCSVEISQVPPMQMYGASGADKLVEQRQGEELQEYSKPTASVVKATLQNSDSRVCSVSGAGCLVEQQNGEELQEPLKRSMLVDNQDLNHSEAEISRAPSLFITKMQSYDVSETDTLTEQQGEEVQEFLKSNTPVDLNESEVEISQASSSPKFEKQLDANSGADNLTEHEYEEEAQEPFKRNTANDNQDFHEKIEISEAPTLLIFESQVSGDDVEEVKEYFEKSTSVNDHDTPSGIQFEDATGNSITGTSMVHNDCVVVAHVKNRQSAEQAEDKMDSPNEGQEMENNVLHKNDSVLVEQSRAPEKFQKGNDLGKITASSMVHDCVIVGHVENRQSAGQSEEEVARLGEDQDMENHVLHKNDSVLVEQSRSFEDSKEDNDLRNITASSESRFETEEEIELIRHWTNELVEVLHENSVWQKINGQGRTIDKSLTLDCRNSSFSLETANSSGTKMHTSVAPQVNSPMQEETVISAGDVINHQLAEGSDVGALADNDLRYITASSESRFETEEGLELIRRWTNEFVVVLHENSVWQKNNGQGRTIDKSLELDCQNSSFSLETANSSETKMHTSVAPHVNSPMQEETVISAGDVINHQFAEGSDVGALADNDLRYITASSENRFETEEGLELIRRWTNEFVEVLHENSVWQKINGQGRTIDKSLELDCRNSSFSLENANSSETKMHTSVAPHVNSPMQEETVISAGDVINHQLAEGSDVGALADNDLRYTASSESRFETEEGIELTRRWTNEFVEVLHENSVWQKINGQGRTIDKSLELDCRNSSFSLETANSSGTKMHTSVAPQVNSQMQEETVISAGDVINDPLAEGSDVGALADNSSVEDGHENGIFSTPKFPNSTDGESKIFEVVSQESALVDTEVDAGTVSTVELPHPHVEEATMEPLTIKPSIGESEFTCDMQFANFINHSDQDSALESEASLRLSVGQTSGALTTCPESVCSSIEKKDLPVQTISNRSTPRRIRGHRAMNDYLSKEAESNEVENDVSPMEDKVAVQNKRDSLDNSKLDALSIKHKITAVPFSDEWLAALEAAGEDILSLKTGPVQNSPPDKSLPEPSPWSPVKRKTNHEIGPFDCTKCTSLPPPHP